MTDEFLCQIHRAFALHTHAQKNRQQFGIGQCARAQRQKFFARAVMNIPVGNGHIVYNSSR